jgi:hypothetical protein
MARSKSDRAGVRTITRPGITIHGVDLANAERLVPGMHNHFQKSRKLLSLIVRKVPLLLGLTVVNLTFFQVMLCKMRRV